MNKIHSIDLGSIAEELEIESGDSLLSINGKPIIDILDYMYLTQEDYIEIEILKANGEIWELEIEKDFDESLGINFENQMMDDAKRCSNQCVFCFIDQLPKGMRDSLYFKDDDSRLSFLQGNFVTLTNLNWDDIDRIIEYKISPINVSVHTTQPELRVKMLGNRFSGDIVKRLQRLVEGGIVVNAQIVLCPGYNDKEELEMTLETLYKLTPRLNSVAIVPIGLTRYREGLIEMKPVDSDVASDTIERVHRFQEKALSQGGSRFAFLADEIYLQANHPFPSDEAYEGYLQFEDGIGMITKLSTAFEQALKHWKGKKSVKRSVKIITGVAAYATLLKLAQMLMTEFVGVHIVVVPIQNHFFGERITVVGLLTGKDIIAQAVTDGTFDAVLLPESVFRANEDVLLDDITLADLSLALGTPCYKVALDGETLLKHILIGGSNE